MHTDYFGNEVCFFSVQQIHRRLEITAASRVSVSRVTPPVPGALAGMEDRWRRCSGRRPPGETAGLHQFRFDSPLLRATPELGDYALPSFGGDTPLLVGAQDLNRRIFTDFKYDPVATTVATPLEEAWRNRRGVCQDFAHLAIACLRSLGLPARYVSGYLLTRPAPGTGRAGRAPTPRTRGFRFFVPARDGWISTPPTTCCRRKDTSPSPTDAISATSAPSAASWWAAVRTPSRWRWTCGKSKRGGHEVGHPASHRLPLCQRRCATVSTRRGSGRPATAGSGWSIST